jgi:eukaryotic-like serine/threonine-protein kinase
LATIGEVEESGPPQFEGTIFDSGDPKSAVEPEPPALERGGTLSRYLLVERVGHGGMGVVWSAYDPELDRKVAIKLLRPRSSTGRAEEARARLIREAQAMARLNHPNVMAIHDVGEHDGQVFLAMEFVQGKTLGRWVRATRRGWREIVAMFVQAGRGLAEAHRAGLVHRDFKPANVLIGPDSRARVTDFGLARSVESQANEDETGSLGSPDWSASRIQKIDANPMVTPLTRTGLMLGTPAYMAPEQFEARGFDARSDQFSFCVALWEALHHQRPFAGQTIDEISENVRGGKITAPPSDSRIPGFIVRALRRGLSVDPDARWASMDALLTELSRDPISGRRIGLTAGALLATFVAALVVTPLLTEQPAANPETERCPAAEDPLAQIWDASRRERIAELFGPAGATLALLDYAARWQTMHEELCASGLGPAPRDHARCLEGHRIEFAATVELLIEEPRARERSFELLGALPSLEACKRARYLEVATPIPADPDLAERVESVRRRLVAARVRAIAGIHTEAVVELHALEREAEALAYEPLRAEILTERGLIESTPSRAHELLEQAVTLAIRSAHDASAARAATALTELLGLRLDQPAAGLRWAARAEAWHERIDAPKLARAERLLAEGRIHRRLGDLASARRCLRDVIQLFGVDESLALQSGDYGENAIAIRALEELGFAELEHGGAKPSKSLLATASLLQTHALGLAPDHPETARTAAGQALAELELGRWSAAAELELALSALPDHRLEPPEFIALVELGRARLELGRAELSGGELEQAERHVHAAVAAVELGYAESHPLTIEALLTAARLARLRGRLAECEQTLARVETILEGVDGLESNGAVTVERGELLLARGELERAFAKFEQATAELGAHQARAAEARAGRGRALLELGRPDEGRSSLRQAVALWDALFGPDGHPHAVVSLELLGDHERAATLRAGR